MPARPATAVSKIELVSAAIIASTRITAYISEDLAKDLAKILPFTVLATFLLNPKFFDLLNLLDKFATIPTLFTNILTFIIFIFGIEFILRGFYSIVQLFYSDKEEGEEEAAESETEKTEPVVQ